MSSQYSILREFMPLVIIVIPLYTAVYVLSAMQWRSYHIFLYLMFYYLWIFSALASMFYIIVYMIKLVLP